MEESLSSIEKLVAGELNEQERHDLLEKIKVNPDLEDLYLAEQAAQSAIELKISEDTMSFLEGIQDDSIAKKSRHTSLLFLSSIAASLLFIVASLVTINISHSDNALAEAYNLQTIAVRSAQSQEDIDFNAALKAFHIKDYADAKSKLAILDGGETILSDHIEWLYVLMAFEEHGSKSIDFNTLLKAVLNDENHEFHWQATKLEKELNIFWRRFVVEK